MVSPNALRAMQRLVEGGMAPHRAAALVGGFQTESGRALDVNAHGDKSIGGSFGIYQAHGPRATFMREFRSPTAKDELERQVDAARAELGSTEKRAGGLLERAPDLRSAARAAIAFERPQGFKWANPEAGLHFGKRLANAEALLQAYGGGARAGTEVASVGDLQGPPNLGVAPDQASSVAGLLTEGQRDPILEYTEAKAAENKQAAQQAQVDQARAAAEDARREAAQAQPAPQQLAAQIPIPPTRPALPLSFGRLSNAPFPPTRPRGLLDDWRWA